MPECDICGIDATAPLLLCNCGKKVCGFCWYEWECADCMNANDDDTFDEALDEARLDEDDDD